MGRKKGFGGSKQRFPARGHGRNHTRKDAASESDPNARTLADPAFELGGRHHFTLQEEAGNTAGKERRRFWGRGSKLRSKPVAFISAGSVQPIELPRAQNKYSANDTFPERSIDYKMSHAECWKILEIQWPENRSMLQKDKLDPPLISSLLNSSDMESKAEHQGADIKPHLTSTEVAQQGVYMNLPRSGGEENAPALSTDDPSLLLRCSKPSQSIEACEALEADSRKEVILFTGRGSNSKRKRNCGGKYGGTGPMRNGQRKAARDRENQARKEEQDLLMQDCIAHVAKYSDQSEAENGLLFPGEFQFSKRDLGHEPIDSEDQSSCPKSDQNAVGDETVDLTVSDEDAAVDIDDESMSRSLAKQKKPGLDVDELGVYDGSAHVCQIETPRGNENNIPDSNRSTMKEGVYGDTAHLAEALESFKLEPGPAAMPPRKGKKGRPLPFKVGDAELEASLTLALEKNRLSEKDKKARYQETSRLWGSRGEVDDICVKYPDGITPQEIMNEFTEFLESDKNRLPFPPMDKFGRKVIHNIALRLQCASKSAGTGNKRYPVVYRTMSTPSVKPRDFERKLKITRRAFYRRPDVTDPELRRVQRPRRAGGNLVGPKYRDGQVVAADFPQIAKGNKGRFILEKMGWSDGTALGSSNNKGILEPLRHVVKTTKAGLGTTAGD